MSKKISIVISCYNDPDVVVAIRSAASQTYSNKEIIVINDGSNEDTAIAIETVKELIDILIVQENRGQSNARNNGIMKSSGEFILNLDSDDFFEDNFCELAMETFQRDEDIRIVTCKAIRFIKGGNTDIFIPGGGRLNDFLFSNAALGSSMFRKSDWEKCGGYEENLPILGFEDWELYINILKSGGYCYVIDRPLFNYQIRVDSTTHKIRNLKHDKFQHIILKHQDLYKNNFNELVNNLFKKLKKEESEKLKLANKIDYRLGHIILSPLRLLKNVLKN